MIASVSRLFGVERTSERPREDLGERLQLAGLGLSWADGTRPTSNLQRQTPPFTASRIRNGATLKGSCTSEKAMTDLNPDTTFRGLPLTPEQDVEVRHYIKLQTQRALPWDTPELSANAATPR